MVEVFVHEDGPLVGCEAAEEAVGMGGAAGGTGRDKAVEERSEASLFGGELARVSDDERGRGGGVAAQGFVVAHDLGADEAADNAAEEEPFGLRVSASPAYGERTMGEGLGRVHFAPLALTVGTELGDAGLDLVDASRLIEILHAEIVA